MERTLVFGEQFWNLVVVKISQALFYLNILKKLLITYLKFALLENYTKNVNKWIQKEF